MTHEEYNELLEKYKLDQEQNGDSCSWWQAKIDDLNAEYIAFLEMYLKNVQNQCKAQDVVIQLAESQLGNGYWQKPKPADPIFEGSKETEWEKGFAAGYEEGFNDATNKGDKNGN